MTGKPEHHFAGAGDAPIGSIARMATRLATHARELGLTVVRVKRSRHKRGQSFYLQVRDDGWNIWVLRVSDHGAYGCFDHPHFDLVSRDGVSGEQWMADSLAIIAGGGKAWFDTRGTGSPLPQAPRPKKGPSKVGWKRKDGGRK